MNESGYMKKISKLRSPFYEEEQKDANGNVNVLKIYENTYIKGNTDILGTIDIRNDLFTNKLKIEEKLKVHNFIYISKNLNINNHILF